MFPCAPNEKRPIAKHGFNDATTDPEQIRRWWAANPRANVGIATGAASGIVVLDVDVKKGKDGEAALRGLALPLPPTLEIRTPSGGRHLYFKLPPGAAVRSSESRLGVGLDVRGDRGCVVAPPSAIGKHLYKISRAVDLAPAPEWLLRDRRAGTVDAQGDAPRAEPEGDPELLVIREALRYISADDRGTWLKVGWAIAEGTRRSDEGFALWTEWARSSAKHDPKRDPATMKREYYEPREDGEPKVTLATLYYYAKKGGWPGPVCDGDHYKLAQALVEVLTVETGEPPVYVTGALWVITPDALWTPLRLDDVAVRVGELFGGGKYCRRGGEFKSVAWLAAALVQDNRFFETATVGVAAPGGIWVVSSRGEIRREPLTPAHRQRFRVPADPDLKAAPKKFLRLLSDAFEPADREDQIRLMQQLFGAALTGLLWRYRIAGLLLGVTSSGKSTALTVLGSAFPRNQVAAVSPQKWAHEYFVAALAGIALNIVGELDPKEPLPAGAFKSITGRDVVQGRHPTHRPFSFVCTAAHFFNANRCPPTTDRSDAFFRRWRIVHFSNFVAPEKEIRDLDEEIKREELGAFLGWALRGAAEVARTDRIIETDTHQKLIRRWRVENNSALAFVYDDRECAREKGAKVSGQLLFEAYVKWAAVNGLKAFGRNHFYDALEAGGAEAGVRVVEAHHQRTVVGLKLIPPDPAAKKF